jgi:hypothetical protein
MRIETEIFESTDGTTFVCGEAISDLCSSATRAPRVTDLASFRPRPPAGSSEPGNWAAVGLPTNFVSAAGAHSATGVLLGRPATVEFIPVGFRWDYGDSTVLNSQTGGASWKSLGVNEFTKTSTSHIYEKRGTYEVTAEVVYRARFAYDFDNSWFDIRGTLSVAAPPHTVSVYTLKTVLVARNCHEHPSGPGCGR